MAERCVLRKASGLLPLVAKLTFKKTIDPAIAIGLLNDIQRRCYAARKGTRAKAAKKKVKKEEVKESFMEMYLRKKSKASIIPGRYKVDHWLRRPPEDDIYRQKFYKEAVHSFAEAVDLLREIHHPTMYNSPNSNLYSTVELDMSLNKKNRFMDKIHGYIQYPFVFDTGIERKVVVICENTEEQQKAIEAGAWITGGKDVIKQILNGEIKTKDFDHLVVHVDSLMDLSRVRGILSGKFPSKSRGNIGTNMADLVDKFCRGVEFITKKHPVELDFAWVDMPLGQLTMPFEHLEANVKALLNGIHNSKPQGDIPGSFITRTLLYTKMSGEKLSFSPWEYLPENARKEDIEDKGKLETKDILDESRAVM